MEEKSSDKNLLGKFLDLDISSTQRRELIRRFEKLSSTEKQGIINSIYKRDWQTEETSEAFEAIISLLKCNENAINSFKSDSSDIDDMEEEEEEDEDSDNNSDVCDKCNLLKDKRDEILNEKLLCLFKAIYSKDPELDKITKDAFECMKEKKITGNICPHIKRAIQQCLKIKKEEINRLWMTELTETVNGEKQLKSVKDNVESYIKLTKELMNTYMMFNDSISTIVEVWKPMLNSPKNLDNTFYLLIMTEFVESIWEDRNIKIVIEEIIQNKDDLIKYESEMKQMISISSKLEEITQSIQIKQDDNIKSESDNNKLCSECGSHHHSDCGCNKKSQKKKKNKQKECKQPIKQTTYK